METFTQLLDEYIEAKVDYDAEIERVRASGCWYQWDASDNYVKRRMDKAREELEAWAARIYSAINPYNK